MTAPHIGILPENEEAVMAKKYLVTLTDSERESLLALTKKGSVAARKLTRAHILLQADAHATDETIATALHIGSDRRTHPQALRRRWCGCRPDRTPTAWR